MDSVVQSLIVSNEPEATPDQETSQEVIEQEDEQVEAQAETEIEDEDYTEETAVSEEPQVFAVKVDGEEREVTLDELKRGYSGQSYIQKQMREVSQQKKDYEAGLAQAREMEQRYAQAIKLQVERLQTNTPQKPDPSMRETDPIGYLERMEDYRQQVEDAQRLQLEQQQLQKRQQDEQAQQHQQYVQEQTHFIMEKIPELKNPETAPKAVEAMLAEGLKRGFTEQELKAESDPRMVMALHDLAKMRAQGNLAPQRQAKRGAIKPGAKKAPVQQSIKQAEAARKQMRSSGRVEDVAKFLLTKG